MYYIIECTRRTLTLSYYADDANFNDNPQISYLKNMKFTVEYLLNFKKIRKLGLQLIKRQRWLESLNALLQSPDMSLLSLHFTQF